MPGHTLHPLAQFVTVKGIISRNLRRDYVEHRDRLLRGLTLHRSGREPDGRIAQTLRAFDRGDQNDPVGCREVRSDCQRAVDLFEVVDPSPCRARRDPGNGEEDGG